MRHPLTDYDLQLARRDYKIFWGRIHGKKHSEIASEINRSIQSLNLFPCLKWINRRPNSMNAENIHRKISDICLNDFVDEGSK